jgi:hypothetical protein
LTTSTCSVTYPIQNSIRGSGGSTAIPGPISLGPEVTITSARGWRIWVGRYAGYPAGFQRLTGEGERALAHRLQPADVVGVQVGDHHGIKVTQRLAQHPRIVRQRRHRLAAGQTGVEQHPPAARADQVGHSGLTVQAAAFGREPLHQRQDGHLVHLAMPAQPGLHLRRPFFVGARHPGGVPHR